VSTRGDTTRLAFNSGATVPTTTLIDVSGSEVQRWAITMAPVRTKDGGPVVWPSTRYLLQGTIGAAGRETAIAVDWPAAGGTFVVGAESVRLAVAHEGAALIPAGAYSPDAVFTAWATVEPSARQGVWAPRRTLEMVAAPIPAGTMSPAAAVPNGAAGYVPQGRFDAGAGQATVVVGWWGPGPDPSVVVRSPLRCDRWVVAPAVMGAATGATWGQSDAAGGVGPMARVPVPPSAVWCAVHTDEILDACDLVFDLDLG